MPASGQEDARTDVTKGCPPLDRSRARKGPGRKRGQGLFVVGQRAGLFLASVLALGGLGGITLGGFSSLGVLGGLFSSLGNQ